MRIAVYCSSSDALDSLYYQQAEELGKWIGMNCHTLVYGGARCGLMEAVAKGVRMSGNGNVIGIVPHILAEKNLVSSLPDNIIWCNDLTERKQIMMQESDIFIAMPGSIGTLDEAFSVMAQHIIGIDSKMVIFWNIKGFWNQLFAFFESIKQTGVVNKSIEALYYKADTLEEIDKIIGHWLMSKSPNIKKSCER